MEIWQSKLESLIWVPQVRNVLNFVITSYFQVLVGDPLGLAPVGRRSFLICWWALQDPTTQLMWLSGDKNRITVGGGPRGDHRTNISSVVPDWRGSLSARSPTGIFFHSLTGQRGKDGGTNSLSSSLQTDFTHLICDFGEVSPQECPYPLPRFGTWGWIHFSTPDIVDILKMQRSPQNAGRILRLLKVCDHIPKFTSCCEMAFMKHFFKNILVFFIWHVPKQAKLPSNIELCILCGRHS